MTHGLDRIGMKKSLVGPAKGRDPFQVQQITQFVVTVHQGHQGSVGTALVLRQKAF